MAAEENLTGGQIQEVLDLVIYRSLEPIVLNCSVFDVQITHLLIKGATNKKRKLSALPQSEFIDCLSRALLCTDNQAKYDILRRSKIERGFIYNFIVNFIRLAEQYEGLYQKFLVSPSEVLDKKLLVFERAVGSTRGKLLPTLTSARAYVELVYEFRNSIASNYIKHAYKRARGYVKKQGENFELQDVHQNFLAAVIKAIDKYDSRQGALTSYINYWLINVETYASTEHGHEYGIAYTIPQAVKRDMAKHIGKNAEVNYSVSLDKVIAEEDTNTLGDLLTTGVSVEDTISAGQDHSRMLRLIKAADKQGIARLYLDLEETFTVKEIEQQNEIMRKQVSNT
jgi:hypothetical protein